jgi:hypothetical protein
MDGRCGCPRPPTGEAMRSLLRLIPGVSLLLAMVEEADHIETVIAEQAAAYRLTEEKT